MSATSPSLDDRVAATRLPADQPQVMWQRWRELLFLHWEVDPERVRETLPEGLAVDTFEGRAYLGVVPFFMQGVRPRFCPTVPGVSNFLELNVRTYVHDRNGVPGVWFYSLDANQWLAVRVARSRFHLPYFDAAMTASPTEEGAISYSCRRKGEPDSAEARYRYRGGGLVPRPEPGSLEFFLVERYVLFSHQPCTNRLFAGRVHHAPYPVERAEVEQWSETPAIQAGFRETRREPDLAHYARGVDVRIFPLREVANGNLASPG